MSDVLVIWLSLPVWGILRLILTTVYCVCKKFTLKLPLCCWPLPGTVWFPLLFVSEGLILCPLSDFYRVGATAWIHCVCGIWHLWPRAKTCCSSFQILLLHADHLCAGSWLARAHWMSFFFFFLIFAVILFLIWILKHLKEGIVIFMVLLFRDVILVLLLGCRCLGYALKCYIGFRLYMKAFYRF